MKMDDDKLLQYYLELNGPDAGEWNSSPTCIHTLLATRDYVKKKFDVFDEIQVCNIGIGTGDWDDYLGYWLKGRGSLTSIDIDESICGIFEYRQQREQHPNPSKVLCKSIFDSDLPQEAFDIVTLIGSAINETGDFKKCLDSCFHLIKPGGHLMFMAGLKYTPSEMLEEYISHTKYQIMQNDLYEAFPEYPFFISKIRK
ncbi:bifunctional 2-polyprenyl-6-hydroxyphenol methylase/3-demethylubiquinol 3-O-methyltransferase UbiG [Paenibacillus sp. IHB B 3415]|uniref:class I SAM-dependent methyltransferase n=1 Tax=Paenibacillus sp. IHB B 3415 TaxID=867080 RepID=UPI00069B12E7|nr:class I SAM-dependent methyltransferase [Paenibacillus sp. IHB B 3415]